MDWEFKCDEIKLDGNDDVGNQTWWNHYYEYCSLSHEIAALIIYLFTHILLFILLKMEVVSWFQGFFWKKSPIDSFIAVNICIDQ